MSVRLIFKILIFLTFIRMIFSCNTHHADFQLNELIIKKVVNNFSQNCLSSDSLKEIDIVLEFNNYNGYRYILAYGVRPGFCPDHIITKDSIDGRQYYVASSNSDFLLKQAKLPCDKNNDEASNDLYCTKFRTYIIEDDSLIIDSPLIVPNSSLIITRKPVPYLTE